MLDARLIPTVQLKRAFGLRFDNRIRLRGGHGGDVQRGSQSADFRRLAAGHLFRGFLGRSDVLGTVGGRGAAAIAAVVAAVPVEQAAEAAAKVMATAAVIIAGAAGSSAGVAAAAAMKTSPQAVAQPFPAATGVALAGGAGIAALAAVEAVTEPLEPVAVAAFIATGAAAAVTRPRRGRGGRRVLRRRGRGGFGAREPGRRQYQDRSIHGLSPLLEFTSAQGRCRRRRAPPTLAGTVPCGLLVSSDLSRTSIPSPRPGGRGSLVSACLCRQQDQPSFSNFA